MKISHILTVCFSEPQSFNGMMGDPPLVCLVILINYSYVKTEYFRGHIIGILVI